MVDVCMCLRLCFVFIVCSNGIVLVMKWWKMCYMKLFWCVSLCNCYWIKLFLIVLLLWIFVICWKSICWFVNYLKWLINGCLIVVWWWCKEYWWMLWLLKFLVLLKIKRMNVIWICIRLRKVVNGILGWKFILV